MNIGILTQPLNHNYGGIIQNYALQKVLKDAGMQVETINHHIKEKKSIKNTLRYYVCIVKCLFNKSKKKESLTIKERNIIERNLLYFINKNITLSRLVKDVPGLKKIDLEHKYDAYIVGSDQCWRPRYNQGYLDCMYLSFVRRDVKRIAYAVSFGTDQWEYTEDLTKCCSDLAKMFDLVTVREDTGVKLCNLFLGVAAKQVLDPTLLLTKQDYISLIEKDGNIEFKGDLFNYILDPTQEKSFFINRIENQTGLRSFQVLPKYHSSQRTKDVIRHHIEDCIYPSMATWLCAFRDADMTIVDSFHGMVFSILFNKPFWVIGNKKRGISRFTSLLRMFDLEERLLDESSLQSIDVFKPINWQSVNKILSEKRQESIDILLNALKDA